MHLSTAIDHIYQQNASTQSFEELYRFGYNLVINKHGPFLYEKVEEKIRTFLESQRTPLLETNDSRLLPALVAFWDTFHCSLKLIDDVFMYLNRNYAPQHNKPSVASLSLSLFAKQLLRHPDLLPRIQNLLLGTIRRRREGQWAEQDAEAAFERSIRLLNELGEYELIFERKFFKETKEHFQTASRRLLQPDENDLNAWEAEGGVVNRFMNQTFFWLEEEQKHARKSLPLASLEPLQKLLTHECVIVHLSTLLDRDPSEDGKRSRGKMALLKQVPIFTEEEQERREQEQYEEEMRRQERKGQEEDDNEEGGGGGAEDAEREWVGIFKFLDEGNESALSLLYTLLQRSPSTTMNPLKKAITRYISIKGVRLLEQQDATQNGSKSNNNNNNKGNASGPPVPTESESFVRASLTLKNNLDRLLIQSFQSDRHVEKGIKEGFEFYLNKPTFHNNVGVSKAPSLLAMHMDKLLKAAASASSSSSLHLEDDLENEVNATLSLFQLVVDKDLFENMYKMLMGKRILQGRGVDLDVEKMVLSKLKAECGYQFTSKMEGMLTDLKVSDMEMQKFAESPLFPQHHQEEQVLLPSQQGVDIQVQISVFTSSFWPSSLGGAGSTVQEGVGPLASPSFPPLLKLYVQAFEDHYTRSNTGRVLEWKLGLGSCELRGLFPNGTRRDLIVSTYQILILMLFSSKGEEENEEGKSDTQSFTFQEIKERTRIDDFELRQHLLSLTTPKARLLLKGNRGKMIEDDEVFTLNRKFSHKLRRVRVPLLSPKDVVLPSGLSAANQRHPMEGNEMGMSGIPLAVEEERRHIVEATIVRIMKSRKQLSHPDLLMEVNHQLSFRFQPSVPFVKQRIESLIDRDYLERSKDDRKVYVYKP